ncbi:MAG: radical SAM/SPASM domain-containing protein [Spirochaetia bacterium]|jgi:MoaA/NifB/PqqE/SkfB family radical SAM enzyme|nr:radical SAM/SPASM domain-containing protein [Spirochaetia bacterium]
MDARALFDQNIRAFFTKLIQGTGGSLRPIKLAEAALFQKRQEGRRRRAFKREIVVPPILIASITRQCNLHCEGCYSRSLRPHLSSTVNAEGENSGELSDERFMELFREAIELGVSIILLAGGEPLLRKKLIEKASALPGIIFPVFTNGTLLDEEFLDLARGGTIVPILSIEGSQTETDSRRGEGIHGKALRWMAEMKRQGILFGTSITLTSRNASSALNRRFLESLGALGVSVLFIIEFVPVSPGTESLIVETRQRAMLNDSDHFAGLPFPVVALPGDEEAFGGCLAAGRGFVHVSPEGQLEACPFAPYSDTSLRSASLESALRSPLLAAIRDHHGELTETKGGCALWDKGGWIGALSACSSTANSGND